MPLNFGIDPLASVIVTATPVVWMYANPGLGWVQIWPEAIASAPRAMASEVVHPTSLCMRATSASDMPAQPRDGAGGPGGPRGPVHVPAVDQLRRQLVQRAQLGQRDRPAH